MRTYQLNPGTLLEWEGAWYAIFSSRDGYFARSMLTLQYFSIGDVASTPVGSLSNQSGHGMLKLAGCIKCTTFGSIRTFQQRLKVFFDANTVNCQ